MSNNSQLSARQRIDALLDESSFVEVGAYVTARSTDFNLSDKETPADGVITGYGVIDTNLVFVYSQDASVMNGSIGEMHAKKIANIYDMAVKMGAPVIGLIDCAGCRWFEWLCIHLCKAGNGIRSYSADHSRIWQLWRWCSRNSWVK